MNEKRQQILNTAKELFLKKWYEKASVQDILDTLWISKWWLYHYFDSKEQILDEIVYWEFGELIDWVKTIFENNSLSPKEKIISWLNLKSKLLRNRFNLVQCVFSDDKHIQMRTMVLNKIKEKIYPYLENNIKEWIEKWIFNIPYPEQTINIILWAHDYIFSCSEKSIKTKKEFDNYLNALENICNKLFI